jgi:hypothetical protein
MIQISKADATGGRMAASSDAREPAMAYYRLYHIRGAHFSRSEEIEAADDRQAIDQAERLSGTRSAELWRGGLKIKHISPRHETARG